MKQLFFDDVSSTQVAAKEALSKQKQAFVVLAKTQTAGKGRGGREWISQPGNLFMTIAQPLAKGLQPQLGSFAASVAVRNAIEHEEMHFKWPNDILIQGKKCAGILLELYQDWLLVGVGVNLVSHPENALTPATNLALHGYAENINTVSKVVTEQWQQTYAMWQESEAKLLKQWENHAPKQNDTISIRKNGKHTSCVYKGITQEGYAVIEINGKEQVILSAE